MSSQVRYMTHIAKQFVALIELSSSAYGDSKNVSGSIINLKFQGLCQGSNTALAGWIVISITVLCAHKRNGSGGHSLCPNSNLTGNLAALLLIYYTDLIHINIKDE